MWNKLATLRLHSGQACPTRSNLSTNPPGAGLPVHASLESAFLAHLADVEQVANPSTSLRAGLSYEQQFIKQHAGRWLPELGRTLARSGDEVYGPIGQLLAAGFGPDRSRRREGQG